MNLCIIPARGGSKRIPGKNIKPIFGQPMIFWPLMVLSNLVKARNLLVSTDSDAIIEIVESKGLKVPFKRPKELSDDLTGTAEVTSHALSWFEKNIKPVEYVLTIYPTAVLLSESDLIAAMDSLSFDAAADSIISATTFPFPIQRAFFKNYRGYAEMFEPANYYHRSQDLGESMHDAGQFYLSKADAVRKGKILVNSNVKIQTIRRNKVVDIDTLEDFEVAEEKLKIHMKNSTIPDWKFIN